MTNQRWYWQIIHYVGGITGLFIGFFLFLQGISAFTHIGRVQIQYLIPGIIIFIIGVLCEIIYSRVTLKSYKEKNNQKPTWDKARKS